MTELEEFLFVTLLQLHSFVLAFLDTTNLLLNTSQISQSDSSVTEASRMSSLGTGLRASAKSRRGIATIRVTSSDKKSPSLSPYFGGSTLEKTKSMDCALKPSVLRSSGILP